MLLAGRLVGRVDLRLIIAVGVGWAAISLWKMGTCGLEARPSGRWSPRACCMTQHAADLLRSTCATFGTLAGAQRTEGAAISSLTRNLGASVGISVAGLHAAGALDTRRSHQLPRRALPAPLPRCARRRFAAQPMTHLEREAAAGDLARGAAVTAATTSTCSQQRPASHCRWCPLLRVDHRAGSGRPPPQTSRARHGPRRPPRMRPGSTTSGVRVGLSLGGRRAGTPRCRGRPRRSTAINRNCAGGARSGTTRSTAARGGVGQRRRVAVAEAAGAPARARGAVPAATAAAGPSRVPALDLLVRGAVLLARGAHHRRVLQPLDVHDDELRRGWAAARCARAYQRAASGVSRQASSSHFQVRHRLRGRAWPTSSAGNRDCGSARR